MKCEVGEKKQRAGLSLDTIEKWLGMLRNMKRSKARSINGTF